jgi:hypothetical protein
LLAWVQARGQSTQTPSLEPLPNGEPAQTKKQLAA